MLDINFIRSNPDIIKQDLKKRFQENKIEWVDQIIKLDSQWRQNKKKIDELRHKRNILSLEINKKIKQKQDASSIIQEVKAIPSKIKNLEQDSKKIREKLDYFLIRLPNITHNTVPFGKDSTQNKFIRKWGTPKKQNFLLKNHVELTEQLNIADFEQGREVAGQGFNYLLGDLALLDLALQRYGVDFLLNKGFKLVVPPIVLNKETLSGAINIDDFNDVVYKVENENYYLIGTAEHSLVSYLKNKTINKQDLPIELCALTPCFRKEIGGHGVDTKGLFRMHQFFKVEQVVYTTKEKSFETLEYMLDITESFFKKLNIPFRVIEICSGDLGNKFAKQYDIEAWFPRQNSYKEVTSAGNCTDYQARRLNIKYSEKNEKVYTHILNNTMVATSRAMVAIIENYQQKNGTIKVPTVLVPYMNGLKKITKNL